VTFEDYAGPEPVGPHLEWSRSVWLLKKQSWTAAQEAMRERAAMETVAIDTGPGGVRGIGTRIRALEVQ
jgi:hypothetical protein